MAQTAEQPSLTTRVVQCPKCTSRNRVPVAGDGVPRCGRCHRPLPWIVDADDTTFDVVAMQAQLPVLVDLWASWCGPCRAVSPVLEQVATRLAGRLKLVKVDVDRARDVSERFQVQAVPTLLVLRHATVAARRAGAASVPALQAWVEQTLAEQ